MMTLWPPQALAAIFVGLVVLTIMHRTLFGFLLSIIFGFLLVVSLIGLARPAPVAERVSVRHYEPARIVVPAPDPAASGILLDRWARSSAPLAPLN